ncbi:hypothetical protein ACSBR2_005046 [Camellia fascicularis]
MSSQKPHFKLAIVPTSQPIIAPPIDLVNRYQILGNIPKPSYTSALASDPFPCQSITPMPPNNPYRTTRTDYVLKPQPVHLFYKEPIHKNIHDVNELVTSYFPSGWHFIPSHLEKSITFCKDIIFHHQSIVIKPIYDRVNASKIIYHSLYIYNIVSMDEWGFPFLLCDDPNHKIQYSYYDYIDA